MDFTEEQKPIFLLISNVFSVQLHLNIDNQCRAAGGPGHQLSRHYPVLQRWSGPPPRPGSAAAPGRAGA